MAMSKVVSVGMKSLSSHPLHGMSSVNLQQQSSQRTRLGNGDLQSRSSIAELNVKDLLTFAGCPELLRASDLTAVMRKAAGIYRNSAGSATTYRMSEQVDWIDMFISHNWIMPRIKKCITLCVEFNFTWAAGVLLVYSAALIVSGSLNQLPVPRHHGEDRPFLGKVTCTPLFVFVLLSLRDIMWLLRFKGKKVFLDKTCIHQTDTSVKELGIKKLGAFIKHSERMVVLYTPVYLTKLWTVYEVAAFLSLHEVDKMTVLAVPQAMFFFCGLALCWASQLGTFGLSFVIDDYIRAAQVTAVILGILYSLVVRSWAREKVEILSRVSQFTVRQCNCFSESDRPLVYTNVNMLMQACRAVPRGCSTEVALDAFDGIVRTEVLERFLQSLGRWAFSYSEILLFGFTLSGSRLVDDAASWGAGGLSDREFLGAALYSLIFMFGGFPLIGLGLEAVMAKKLHLRGWRNAAWFVITILPVLICALAFSLLTRRLADAVVDGSTLAVALLVALLVATAALAFGLMQCRRKLVRAGTAIASNSASVSASGDFLPVAAGGPDDGEASKEWSPEAVKLGAGAGEVQDEIVNAERVIAALV